MLPDGLAENMAFAVPGEKQVEERETTAPSNSEPCPMLTVVGEKAFQMMDLQMLVAMNRLMPEPMPYPF